MNIREYQCKRNFLKWATIPQKDIQDEQITMPYVKDNFRCSSIIMIPLVESYLIYTDFESGETSANPAMANYYKELNLVNAIDCTTVIEGALSTLGMEILTTPVIGADYYNVNYRGTIIVNENVSGIFRLKFKRSTDNAYYISSPFRIGGVEYLDYSNIFEWGHSRQIGSLPADEYQRMRIMMGLIARDYETDIKQYRAISDNQLRNVRIHGQPFYTLETYYFDEWMHDAFFEIMKMDYLYVNSIGIIPKAGYKNTTKPHSLISKGTIEVYKTGEYRPIPTPVLPHNRIYHEMEYEMDYE